MPDLIWYPWMCDTEYRSAHHGMLSRQCQACLPERQYSLARGGQPVVQVSAIKVQ